MPKSKLDKIIPKAQQPLWAMAICLLLSFSGYAETDPDSGLIVAPGWEVVKTNCTVCHSAKFITWQRGDRDTWHSMIRWMQQTQGLWQFTPEVEKKILDYLATNYPPDEPSRRKNLPPSAMPQVN